MPAERVTPSRRRKIALACEPCRERKSRCDGGKPICASCRRRSFTLEQCVYKADNARSESNDTYVRALHLRIRELEHACQSAGVDVPSLPETPDRASQPEPPFSGSAPVPPSSARHHPGDASETGQDNARPVDPVPAPQTLHGAPAAAATPRLSEWAGNGARTPSQRTPASAIQNDLESTQPEGQVSAMGTFAAGDAHLYIHSTPEYFGHSSAASFMQQACLDPAGGVHPSTSHYLAFAAEQCAAGTQSSAQLQLRNAVLPPRPLADHLLEAFWDRIFCQYPFFHRKSFERQYERLWAPSTALPAHTLSSAAVGLGGSPETPGNLMVFHCALNAIFALGCHFSSFPAADREPLAFSFFLRAKAFIGLDLLEVNSIGVVQSLLLTALCLQSTPFPSRCWNAVGVACRVAQGLGLHTDVGDSSRDALGIDIRRRTWHGCVHMDITVSMMLGRPPATLPSPLPLPSVLEDEDICRGAVADPGQEQPSWKRFFVEAIKLNRICAAIMSEIYQPWLGTDCLGPPDSASQKIFTAVDVLAKLDLNLSEFESRLPSFISWTTESPTSTATAARSSVYQQQKNVLHARFLHLKLMLYRPIFTFLCNCNRNPASTTSTNTSPLYSAVSTQCALSCAITAMDLLDHVYDTYLSSATDAWWYNGLYASTAGIVIIMAHSCPQVIGSVDEARLKRSWERCVEILQHLSTYNVPSKNQLNLLQRAYAQRISDQPFPSSTNNPRQNRSGVQQPTSMPNATQSWDQPAQNGSAFESQGVDNYLSGNDGMTDFAAEGFGFFDSMNFFEGGFPNFVSG